MNERRSCKVNIISPKELKEMLRDGKEIALIDVREQGVFYKEHQLLASSIPLSHLELRIDDMAPRRATRIVFVDEGGEEDLAVRAARRLKQLGYTNIAVLNGGIRAWGKAGYELFSGVNVPSKAFGEIVEKTYNTPRLTANELKAMIDGGEKLVILDSRPKEEYSRMNIPGGIDTPGAELVLRVHDLAPDPATFVVVNCAGRTRSIIGTQSLINAGIPNPVAALKDGTMGWHLAGFDLEEGMERCAPEPSTDGFLKAKACAERVAERFGVKKIDCATLEKWRGESDNRTLYVFDVRLPEEFEAGHLEYSRNTPGGQLVQAADEYIAVRNACVVLVDTTEVQSVMTASWLIQLGWNDVYILQGGIGDAPIVTGPSPLNVTGFVRGAVISPIDLKGMLDSEKGVVVIDLACSKEHIKSHIPGSWWCVRSRLTEGLNQIQKCDVLVLTSEDGILAHLAAGDIKDIRPGAHVNVLDGGNSSWINSDLPIEEGMNNAMCAVDDVWYKPYEQKDAPEKAMRDYLTWEIALIEKVERDGDARFRVQDISLQGKRKKA